MIEETKCIKAFVRCCTDAWLQGWHERNGGNLSYRLTDKETEECRKYFKTDRPWTELGVEAENLAGEYFIVTGSGKYMRNVEICPEENICVIELDKSGTKYRIVWGLSDGGVPTSELPTHIMNHSVKLKAGTDQRVIYHAHTPSLNALTFVLPLTSRDFTRMIWKTEMEMAVICPEGLGVIGWMLPGGAEIAKETCKLMERFNAVLWAHHGLFCSGDTLDSAFGLMHAIEKTADTYIKALSCGQGIRTDIPDDGIRAIGKRYGTVPCEEFLEN